VGERPLAGYRTVPHTADVRIEAWAPTREQCVAEAVAALVAAFAHWTGEEPADAVEFTVEAGANEDMLAAVLDEVIYRLDTTGQLPAGAQVRAADGDLRVQLQMTDVDRVDIVGATPKAVSFHDLRFEPDAGGGWSCGVTLDV
jgi:SHS2 domain-containing protein